MSRHHITAIHDPDGAETEVLIHYVWHAGFSGRFHIDPQPPEPPSVEFDRVEIFILGKWVEHPKLSEWAEAYLTGDGLDNAMTTAREYHAAEEDYRAEIRAERWRG